MFVCVLYTLVVLEIKLIMQACVHLCAATHLILSVCVLYSMMVFGGRLRTLRRVSLMRAVVA